MRRQLEIRDYEILRTLGRLRFLTSAEINRTFFSSEFTGYRRLRKLEGLNLVRRHTNGAPPRTNYCAWRLTSAGIAAMRAHFPNEALPDALEERMQRQSLIDMEHREGLSQLYLDVLAGSAEMQLENASLRAARDWSGHLRRRADRFDWQPDGDVILQFRELADDHRIMPDAVAKPRSGDVRVFVELDRSQKTLGRIEENLRHYASFVRVAYADRYPDGRRPLVFYVVRSADRHANITRLADQILRHACGWAVAVLGPDATTWLAQILVGDLERGDGSAQMVLEHESKGLRLAAEEFIAATNHLLKDASAVFEELSALQPEAMGHWKRTLKELYARVKEPTHG